MDTRSKVASNIEELRTLVTGQFAVSYVAFFLSRFGVFLAIDAENQIGNSISAALIFTAISEATRLLILFLADKIYLSNRHEVPAKLKIVILTWFVSAFGGSIVGGVVLEMIPQFSGHLINRVIPSGTFAFIGFALVSIVVAQVHNDRLNLSKLQEQINLADGEQKQMITSILNEQSVREVEARLQISEGLKNLQLQIDQISATSKETEIYKLVKQTDLIHRNNSLSRTSFSDSKKWLSWRHLHCRCWYFVNSNFVFPAIYNFTICARKNLRAILNYVAVDILDLRACVLLLL